MSRQDWMGVSGFITIGAAVCRLWLSAPAAFTWIAAGALVVLFLFAAVEYDWFDCGAS